MSKSHLFRGQWIVCVRDVSAGNDDYLGPYHSEGKACEVQHRLDRNIKAVGAEHILTAHVEWVDPDVTTYRDKMLAELAEQGYAKEA